MKLKVVIFLGPTLPSADARGILDAVYLPPAREADLISAVTTYRPQVIGLLDGVFGQSLSVWHKEILFALESGVHVYGASSIGALRAAETSAFGTIGVGEVYRMYASGELEDDDEVALAHAGVEEGYRGLSEPMVNLRKTFAVARNTGICDPDSCDRFVAAAKSIYFPERTIPRIIADALAGGVPAPVVDRMRHFLKVGYVDVKRHDAILLLQTIRDLPDSLQPFAPKFRLERPHFFDLLYERDRTVRHTGVDVPLHTIADYAALHIPEFGDLNFHAMNRAFAVAIADILGVRVSAERVQAETTRFRNRHALQAEGDFRDWLSRNHLSLEEWNALMREVAVCRHLHRWLMLSKRAGNTRAVLDELRLSSRYEEVCAAAAGYEGILQNTVPEDLIASGGEVDLRELVLEHAQQTQSDLQPDIVEWAEEAGFASLPDLRVELLRARFVRERMRRAARALLDIAE